MPRRLIRPLLLMGLLGASCKPSTPAPSPPPPRKDPAVNYGNEVRPILARKCFSCHGQLDLANESGVRLDSREHGTKRRAESGAQPIFPGDPSRSALLQKLFVESDGVSEADTDPAHTVTTEEHALLSKWIEQGAFYGPHWAFEPLPEEVPLPPSRRSLWPLTPFDQFTLASLGDDPPAPALPPIRWLHRAALDLTGLPPEPRVVEEFQQNLASGKERTARQIAVDQLLASPAFGEHMATRWLQRARYSDLLAPGHLATRQAYRDWVIRAFNENLPYDQFLTAQLAGDLVQPGSNDHLIATAFLRLHPLPVSSAQPVEESTALRTELVARTMLGLELRCARCHDHPLDPLTPEDHRSLQAFFGGTGESALLPAPGVTPTPSHLVLTKETGDTLHARTLAEGTVQQAVADAIADGEERFTDWLATPDKLPLISDLIGAYSFDQDGERSPNLALGGNGAALTGTLPAVPGLRGKARQLDGQQAIQFPDLPPLTRSNAFSLAFWIQLPALPEAPVDLLTRTDGSPRGLQLRLTGGYLEARLTRDWPGNALGIRSTAPVLTAGTWHHLAWSYDGSSTAEGLLLWVDGRPVDTSTTANHLWKSATAPGDPLLLGGHPGLAGALLDDVQVFSRALTAPELAHLHDSRSLTEAIATADPDSLRNYYFFSIDPEVRALAGELPPKRAAVVRTEDLLPEVSIMRQAGSTGEATTPEFLPPLNAPALPPTRLDLARWLTDPSHPLTARVHVNHLWENFLGHPLVAGEGLGIGSPAPDDQALLDWLARDFVNHGWDVKDLCRRIVLSATYRQSTRIPLDPVRFRDRTLAASGLLRIPDRPTNFPRSLYLRWPLPEPSSPHPCPASEAPPRPGSTEPAMPIPLFGAERATILHKVVSDLEARAPNHDAGRLAFLFRSLTGREPTINELASLGALVRSRTADTSGPQSPWADIAAKVLHRHGYEALRAK